MRRRGTAGVLRGDHIVAHAIDAGGVDIGAAPDQHHHRFRSPSAIMVRIVCAASPADITMDAHGSSAVRGHLRMFSEMRDRVYA